MSRFHTPAFAFDLPGEDWVENTMQTFVTDGGRALFVGRTTIDPDTQLEDVLDLWLDATVEANEKVEREPKQEMRLGHLEALELRATAYDGDEPDYFRLIAARYYDRAVVFTFAGPALEQPQIDALAERTEQEIAWRKR